MTSSEIRAVRAVHGGSSLSSHLTFPLAGLYPSGSFLSPWTLLLSFPTRVAAEGAEFQQARKLGSTIPPLYRSSWLNQNMLDGLKMEENFQSAIETSASFSSLLGKCSTSCSLAHPPSARAGSSGRQFSDTGLSDQTSTLFVHTEVPTLSVFPCPSVLLSRPDLNTTSKPPQASRAQHRIPQSLEGRASVFTRYLSGK